METVTLVSMLAAATIGAWIGAGFVSKLPEKKIQMIMGVALLITAGLMAAGRLGIILVAAKQLVLQVQSLLSL